MALVVQKFGGTSVADPEARERALSKVTDALARGDRVIAVVSAMGRKGAPYATDTLLGLLDEAAGIVARGIVARGSAADGLARDLMASCGETIAACLFAELLSARGARAVPLTAYSAGIRASGTYGDAELREVDADRILAVVDSGAVPVVAGFQAVAPNGGIVTLGRGGSDTSAVAIGGWARADYVDIYKDVPGVAVADPRLVPEAPYLARLDYASMYRLAAAGARVLHDRSALLAQRFGVRIRVRSTFDDGDGTLIGPEPLADGSPPLVGVATRVEGDVCIATMVCRGGLGASLSAEAERAALSVGARRVDARIAGRRSAPKGEAGNAPKNDPDEMSFACAAERAPELARALLTAAGMV